MPKRRPRRAAGVPSRAFVDSGAFVALASADDAHHVDADAVFRQAIAHRTRLVTSRLVVAEVHRLLLYRAGIRAALAAITSITASPSMVVEQGSEEQHRGAMRWLTKLDDQVVTYTDAWSFAWMEANRCDVAISFDDDFVIAGFRPWRAALPTSRR